MQGGKLRHEVVIQSPTGTRDAFGKRDTTWNNVATVRAQVRPVTSAERYAAAQFHGAISHRVTIRYDAALANMDHSWRVLFGTRVLVLVGPPRNIDERNRTLELLCQEGMLIE